MWLCLYPCKKLTIYPFGKKQVTVRGIKSTLYILTAPDRRKPLAQLRAEDNAAVYK